MFTEMNIHRKSKLHRYKLPSRQGICKRLRVRYCKVKVISQPAEVTQGVQCRLRPRIFLTFSTTRVVGRQPYAPAAFTPREIPGTHFQRLSRPQGRWFRRETRKNPQWHHRESILGPPD